MVRSFATQNRTVISGTVGARGSGKGWARRAPEFTRRAQLPEPRPRAPAGPGPHPTRAAIQRASPLHHLDGVWPRYAAATHRRDLPEDEFQLARLILRSHMRPGTLPVGHHEGRTLGTMTRLPAPPLASVPACSPEQPPDEQPPDEITRGLFGVGRRLTRAHPLVGDALLAAVLL